MRIQTSIGVVVCVIGMSFVASDAGARWLTVDQIPETVAITDPTSLPPNITVGFGLHDVVAQMLRESETFRRQLLLIGGLQRVRVQVILEDYPGRARERVARARCDLARYEFGGVTARVQVWSREDAIELVAHELEHVIEVAKGANYRALAVIQPGAVWAAPGGTFETARAIQAGLQVEREVRLVNAQLRRRQ